MMRKSVLIPLLIVVFLLGTVTGYLLPKKDETAATPQPTPTAGTTPGASVGSSSTSPTATPRTTGGTSTTSVTSPASTPADPNLERVQSMTLDEKIGQMLLVGIDGTEMNDQMNSLIKTYHAGGVILYKPNIESASQTVTLVNALKKANAANSAPLFLGVDEEGGRVSRLPAPYTKMPTSRSIGQVDKPAFSYEVGRMLARQVASLGLNLDFAPVMDVDSNPDNPVIGDRSFGRSASIVSSLGVQTMKGLQAEGVVTALKHFPGHGDTSVDSHLGLPIVNHNLERLRSLELIPFSKAVKAGADMVMVAHILLPALDADYPASFSKPVITDLLRGELGYDGVVITDDLTMGAVTKNYTLEKAAVKAIQAGGDILLVGHGFTEEKTVFNAVKDAVQNGTLSEERLNESVLRILKLKEKYQLNDNAGTTPDVNAINQAAKKLLNTYIK
ncbi:beta-N-acetylhexosaminidase [Gorillibacterium massiliense]|uniref:beta-N-acetylhexosaminidase n=1 Tax=Gorillibacterium massiliense TaxID=1280390 RepID=UPI0004B75965|nr:beta-N-acetylhexosaminidase [Gorillibacterium massiliense]